GGGNDERKSSISNAGIVSECRRKIERTRSAQGYQHAIGFLPHLRGRWIGARAAGRGGREDQVSSKPMIFMDEGIDPVPLPARSNWHRSAHFGPHGSRPKSFRFLTCRLCGGRRPHALAATLCNNPSRGWVENSS